jgi:hypothetical protein
VEPLGKFLLIGSTYVAAAHELNFYYRFFKNLQPLCTAGTETWRGARLLASCSLSPSNPPPDFAFHHIRNYDDPSRSVCLRCRSAVATLHYEDPLEQAESTHTCTQPDPHAC